MDHLTWEDIVTFVSEMHTREGGQPSRSLYRMLANQCLRELGETGPIRRTSWTNDGADGSPVITSNSVTLPADLITVDSVEWDDNTNPLLRTTIENLDEIEPDWRERSGDPTKYAQSDSMTLILNSIPSGTITSKLVIRGTAYLPEFSDTATDPNPLEYFPLGQQLIVAYYILWKLPVVGAVPINDSPSAATLAQFETQRRVETRDTYKANYADMLSRLMSVDNRRKRSQFTY